MQDRNLSRSNVSKPKVLTLLGCYLPGFNSGGPVRTLSCMVEALAPGFEFRIVTLNHDSGSREIYDSVQTGEWNAVGSGKVFYVPRWTLRTIRDQVKDVEPDVLYLNGFFSTSTIYALAARRLGVLPDLPTVIAPRGDLAQGALGLKAPKKRSYMSAARLTSLYSGLLWHASSEREKSDIVRQLSAFGIPSDAIHVAPDLGFGYDVDATDRPEKRPGSARFVLLSRLVRMKNPLFAIDRLAELHGEISLDIFGPIEDRELYRECEYRVASLPANISVRFLGSLDPARVLGELSQRHFFILPTLGENYGHAIIEGAAAGCPVIISDRTQWLGLAEQGAGWDLPLDLPSKWREVLQHCVDMGQEQYDRYAKTAAQFGRSVINSKPNLDANVALFRRALSLARPASPETTSVGVSR